MKNPDILAAMAPVVKAFEELGIPYYISGSIASSVYGTPRSTLDVDMVSDLKPGQVHSFVEMLQSAYYVDEKMILNAIDTCSSFNLIHLETMIKVDIFIAKDSPYQRETFRRRKKDSFDEEDDSVEFNIASFEDIILSKLEWCKAGGNISKPQWYDVLGVLKVQKNLLDMEYLRRWAAKLKIIDLLEQAFRDAEI
ncbi:MAG: hypothetical protein L6422_08135 [Candidatus Marinimicrobia bacterium]|nr:hypothetical protein [bacterium]MCG2716239.1 hypothetical protein [Candidatus Neomarinimicrobiota bacterium]